jgi:regulator of protease activity HflC (stomatin/prohibitin superfamily)
VPLHGVHFHQAHAQVRRLTWAQFTLATGAVVLLGAAALCRLIAPATLWPALGGTVAATLILLAAALQAARWPAQWRAAQHSPLADEPAPEQPSLGVYDRLVLQGTRWVTDTLGRIGLAPLYLGGWSVIALAAIRLAWASEGPAGPTGAAGQIAAVLALVLGFALLVVERHLAATLPDHWPEAPALLPFFRLAILAQLLSAPCLLFASPEHVWPVRLAVLFGLIPACVAVELLVRAVLSVFAPRRPDRAPDMLATSFIAGLLQWPPRPLQALQSELQARFGIDLRQVWAFDYMRRAALPVMLAVLGLGWLLTGVQEVALDERGVYERLGSPVQVLGPGVHCLLPWPLGRVIPVENGVVHELATGQGGAVASSDSSADGPAPETANRLWDATHVRDNMQVIASGDGAQQSFQVVNMDVRFLYRLGLTDADALAATYHTADVPGLIRDTAGRVLVQALAWRTLEGLLGSDRTGLADQIGAAVQADLRRLDSGVDILGTVIEAIHPPAGAATAYHAVQAARISAQALVARERGAAAAAQSTAQLDAFDSEAQAQAGARESRASADAAQRLFEADRGGYAEAGQAFVFERYLAQLRQGLGLGQARLLILDHRLGAGGAGTAPTLDLRSFIAPVDPTPPRAAH